jgi:hypothetical protein
MFAEIKDTKGKLDVVFANAGIYEAKYQSPRMLHGCPLPYFSNKKSRPPVMGKRGQEKQRSNSNP